MSDAEHTGGEAMRIAGILGVALAAGALAAYPLVARLSGDPIRTGALDAVVAGSCWASSPRCS